MSEKRNSEKKAIRACVDKVCLLQKEWKKTEI